MSRFALLTLALLSTTSTGCYLDGAADTSDTSDTADTGGAPLLGADGEPAEPNGDSILPREDAHTFGWRTKPSQPAEPGDIERFKSVGQR